MNAPDTITPRWEWPILGVNPGLWYQLMILAVPRTL